MSYSAPELQLVGAAQNLVLAFSLVEQKNDLECRADYPGDIDITGQLYNEPNSW